MLQQPSSPLDLPTAISHHVVMFPTWCEPPLPTEVPEPSAVGSATGRRAQLRRRAVRKVVVIEAAGRLGEVVDELGRAIQLALAEGPRGVVCDLSAAFEGAGPAAVAGAGPAAVAVLASAGRHCRDWPGIPLAVACPDPRVREALRAHELGGHLIVTESLFAAVSGVLATTAPAAEWLRLAPHPKAPRAAREFVTRTLLDWRLGRAIPFATLVVSELVTSSSVNAGTEIDLCVAWDLGALRLTVRDHGPRLPSERQTTIDLRGRARTVVAGLSRASGVLPTADGGKVVWAVLDAPRPRSSTDRIRSEPAPATQSSPVFTDGLGMGELPFCAGSSQPPAILPDVI